MTFLTLWFEDFDVLPLLAGLERVDSVFGNVAPRRKTGFFWISLWHGKACGVSEAYDGKAGIMERRGPLPELPGPAIG